MEPSGAAGADGRRGDRAGDPAAEAASPGRGETDLCRRARGGARSIRTPFTTPACWRTKRAAPRKPSTSSGRAWNSARIRLTGIAIWGSFFNPTADSSEAIAEYERAIELDPGHANAHSNLGVLLRAAGRPEEAETAYRTAIRLCPDHADAYTNLGVLLNGLNRAKEASECFCKAITLRPRHPDARRLLALAHCMIGEVDEAVKVLEEWLADEPGEPIAQHMLAASTGGGVPLRASNAFVEKTFDAFAASFEAKLQSLAYRAPDLVAATLADAGLSADGRAGDPRHRLRDRAVRATASAVRVATRRGRPVRRDARPRQGRRMCTPSCSSAS